MEAEHPASKSSTHWSPPTRLRESLLERHTCSKCGLETSTDTEPSRALLPSKPQLYLLLPARSLQVQAEPTSLSIGLHLSMAVKLLTSIKSSCTFLAQQPSLKISLTVMDHRLQSSTLLHAAFQSPTWCLPTDSPSELLCKPRSEPTISMAGVATLV